MGQMHAEKMNCAGGLGEFFRDEIHASANNPLFIVP
jgi:hypothetical protein